MCRWLAYSGQPIFMNRLLFEPQNSLINQSLQCRKGVVATNGDGFGVGWYGTKSTPGLYRDIRPAWNDDNLRSLAEQIEARQFFAHVRASTGTATSRVNCHPFRWGKYLFMHNGKIGGYESVRRTLEFQIREDLYPAREGSTDSELFFYLLIGHGLESDPVGAFSRAVGDIEAAMTRHGVTDPLRITCAVSDGTRLYALRHSSDRQSPSLYYGVGGCITVEDGSCRFTKGDGSVLVLSEPLDTGGTENWHAVGESQLITVLDGHVEVTDFTPRATSKFDQAAE